MRPRAVSYVLVSAILAGFLALPGCGGGGGGTTLEGELPKDAFTSPPPEIPGQSDMNKTLQNKKR